MKTTRNNVTGDLIKSKPQSDKYRDGYDNIFGKKQGTASPLTSSVKDSADK